MADEGIASIEKELKKQKNRENVSKIVKKKINQASVSKENDK